MQSLASSTSSLLPSEYTDSLTASIAASDFNEGRIEEKGKSTIPSASFNLANSAIGAGVLAFPFAFYQTGMLLGIIVTVFQVVACSYTLEWIGIASEASHRMFAGSYEQIVKDQLGSAASFISILCLLGNMLGAMIGFIIIIGDMTVPIATQLFGDHFLTGRAFITFIFVALIIIPISSFPNIDNLKFTSFLSLISITFVVFVVFAKLVSAIYSGSLPDPMEITWVNFSPDVFQAIPVITFALTCHAQAPPIYHELKDHSAYRFRYVIGMTYLTCFTLYVLNGISGYSMFQEDTKDNILKNFASDDWVANIARLCVTFTVTFSYPLANFSFRLAFDFLVFNLGYTAIFGKHSERLPAYLDITIPTYRRYLLETIIAAILCWIVNVVIPSISIVFGLIGALAGSCIVFIFPALLHYKRATSVSSRIGTIVVMIIGAVIGIVGTAVIILDFF